MLTFRSFCSGIGAPEAAWSPLGWRCLSVSEIDAQASAVLAHHYPGVPNVGDMTTCTERMSDERADILVAGTPCQSFSVAGLRKGLDDPRGNLALVYLGLVDRLRPEWVVWENVPGVLSSSGGRDFGSFLGALGQLGYGWAYRVLDAQFVRVESHARAVPQRRRRVFVVGCLGDWRGAAAVLLERESLRGDPAPSRATGEGTAAKSLRCATGGIDREDGHTLIVPDASPAMKSRDCKGPSSDGDGDGLPLVAHTLKSEGHDASEDGTGRGTPLVAFYPTNRQPEFGNYEGVSPAIKPGSSTGGNPPAIFQESQSGCREYETSGCIRANGPGHDPVGSRLRDASGVRRLTPRECERLQGFSDDYTAVPWKGKLMADGPRYRMLGNSMAVNVMSWIGQRIQMAAGVTA